MSDTRFLTIEVTDATWRALINIANADGGGIRPSDMASLLFVRGLESFAKEQTSAQSRLFVLAQHVTDTYESKRVLIGIASNLLQYPDDERMEQFLSLCDDLSFSSAEILAFARGDGKNVMAGASGSITKVGAAENFLLSVMSPGKEYSAKAMLDKAKEQGISESHLKAARSYLGVSSYRGSEGFIWMLPVYDVSAKKE